MVQYYLARTNHIGNYVYGESSGPGSPKCRGLSEEPAILGQITGSRSFEASPSVRPGRRDTQKGVPTHAADMQSLSRRYTGVGSHSDASSRTEKVIHHTMNMDWLSHRFESANSAVAHSSWATTSGTVGGITHHSVNMNLLSQHNKTGSVGHADSKGHTIDTAQLRRRYGSLADGITALNALQSNNYYYDMLSRRNVIGGY
jgi:hypothetical protein